MRYVSWQIQPAINVNLSLNNPVGPLTKFSFLRHEGIEVGAEDNSTHS